MTVIKKKSPKKETTSKSLKRNLMHSFPIVGIGASAGGLEAFEKFFRNLPNIGMAYIVVTHLDRDHDSILPALIKKYTNLPVKLIKNKMEVEPDVIYIIPPNKNISIKNCILNFVEQSEPHYANLPINFFLHTLAKDKKEKAIAVILSGSGSDGSLGVRDINESGGLIIVQDPLTASFDSMPHSAINTGLVDYVMAAEEIPEQLKKYLKYGKVKNGKISPELQQIFIMLRAHTGHDFSHYKLNTICRRIEKQMYLHQIKTVANYSHFLQRNRHELDSLFKSILIGVTRFFRDQDAFEVLKRKIIPELLKNKPNDYCIRVWVPACSTGEEAYSIAIILRECMDKMKKYFNVQIFGTDIDLNALETSRAGIYPETISADVDADRLKRYFSKDRNSYKLKKEIRSIVIFGEQNVIKDPPFTKLDLICCRNLLIYLNVELQQKLLPLFHYSLKPKGILFLGASEATSSFTEHFQLIAKKWKIFRRKDVISPSFPLLNSTMLPRIYDNTILPFLEQKDADEKLNFIHALQLFLLSYYLAPAIVINKTGEILYIHGNIDNYLRSSKKKTNLTIEDHLYADVKLALIPAIRRSELQKKNIVCKNLNFHASRNSSSINLHVIPIPNKGVLQDLTLIVFEEYIPPKSIELSTGGSLKKKNLQLAEVIEELNYTKENLQASIEELESANEELQSTNEELQSTNEEIETSKEELQSLNEELIIVNTELQNTIDQLASVNDDMNNLFNGTEIAAFFLDNNLHIKRFTPKAQKFIHLVQTDIGRSISHFSTTIKYDKLFADAEEVLKTLLPKNIEVETHDQHWYYIRILPYRTLSNMIDGVIITLTDISRFKEYEFKLKQLNDNLQASLTYTENILNTVREPLLILDENLKIISANRSFYKTFKIKESETLGKFIYKIINKQFDIPALRNLLEEAILKNKFFEGFKLEQNFSTIGWTKFILNARKISSKGPESQMILLALEQA